MKRAFVLASLFFVACGTPNKAPVADDFSEISDEKADAFSRRMQIVGTLADPAGSVAVAYTAQPLYRAVKLHGTAGDWVKVDVRAGGKIPVGQQQPDPVAFFLDSRFKVLAKNDDAAQNVTSSQIVLRLKRSGTFYVVVRDYNYASVSFQVDLQLARPSGDLLADANSWFQLFLAGDEYGTIADGFSVPVAQMPQAAQDDANGFFKQDVGSASGYAFPYDSGVMYFLVGTAEEAYDARPYDSDGNPIADTAIGGDAGDIAFGVHKTGSNPK